MGRKDLLTRKYVSKPRHFADLINVILYRGQEIIRADDLTEKDTLGIVMPYIKGKKSTLIKRYRDILKKCVLMSSGKCLYLLIGIENQSDIHYAMPVRNMLYNAITYAEQVDEIVKRNRMTEVCDNYLTGLNPIDKILPVITFTLYWGDKKWDGPVRLKEMLVDYDKDLDRYIDDCNINLFSIIDENGFERFHTELGKVFKLLNARNDGVRMKNIASEDADYENMDKESAEIIKEFTTMKMPRKNRNREGYNVCKAVKEIREMGIKEGISQGISQGIAQGLVGMINILKPFIDTAEEAYEKIKMQAGYENITLDNVKEYWNSAN